MVVYDRRFLLYLSAIFSTMKTKMMLIMVTFCVLVVFHENMSVEAGVTKVMRKYRKEYVKCCKAIKCLPPKICEVTSVTPFKCKCDGHVNVD